MTQVELQPTIGKTKRKVHPDVKVDMTPMVDLGFLLITFFIFTTTLTQPNVTKLLMPKESDVPMPVPESTLLTALVDKDKIIIYEGDLKKAIAGSNIVQTNYNMKTGMGYFVRQ